MYKRLNVEIDDCPFTENAHSQWGSTYLQVTQFVLQLTPATLNSSKGNETYLPDRTKIEIKELSQNCYQNSGEKLEKQNVRGMVFGIPKKNWLLVDCTGLLWLTFFNFPICDYCSIRLGLRPLAWSVLQLHLALIVLPWMSKRDFLKMTLF